MDQLLLQRYELLERITDRGSSDVWKAFDRAGQTFVVLKFPSPSELPESGERIKNEAVAYRALGPIHGLVRFIGYEDNEGHELGPFLVLEFLDGITLNLFLCRGVLSELETIAMGRSICEILGKLHDKGVVHRDISLNNIFLLKDTNEVRLIDLGLALVPNTWVGYVLQDTTGVGTAETMAPELSWSLGDARSDIYSLGEVLYLMANSLKDRAAQEKKGIAPSAVSRVSEALSAVIVRSTKYHPDARYQSILELDEALAATEVVLTAPEEPLTPEEPPIIEPTPTKEIAPAETASATIKAKKPTPKLLGALAFMAGLGGVVGLLSQKEGPMPTPNPAPPEVSLAEATPATIPSLPPSPSSVPTETPQPPSKQTKPRPTAKPIIQALPTETAKEPPTETPPKPLTEEEEIDAINRKLQLEYATKPIALPTRQPIDIIIVK
jgi:serine/threonine protein kinase